MTVPLHMAGIITTKEGKKFAPAGRMATVIIEIIREKGTCSLQDLNEKGFSAEEVAEHWHMAQSFAAVEISLMDKDISVETIWNKL